MNEYFLKVRSACPRLKGAAFTSNLKELKQAVVDAHNMGVQILVLPQYALAGVSYSQMPHPSFLEQSEQSLEQLAQFTKERDVVVVLGCELRINNAAIKCVAVLARGKILGLSAEEGCQIGAREIFAASNECAFGNNLLFKYKDFCFAAVAGEVNTAYFAKLESAGVQMIINPSSAPRFLSTNEDMVRAAKALDKCAYVHCSDACAHTNAVGSGLRMISECGEILAAADGDEGFVDAQIDADFLNSSCHASQFLSFNEVAVPLRLGSHIEREYQRLPFVPQSPRTLERILDTLARATYLRMNHIGLKKLVFGVSGGLDSTLVALISQRLCQKYDILAQDVLCATMGSKFSSQRTANNAQRLIKELGFTHIDIPITPAFELMLSELKHDGTQNITFENAQARIRSQFLLNLANMHSALFLGTGDMSEAALGWSTFGGDQLAMFNPNSGIAKTLVRALVHHAAQNAQPALKQVLADICATPISPELKENQATEDTVGKYEINDFLLYHIIFRGASQKKAALLAQHTFPEVSKSSMAAQVQLFMERFIKNQFKINASCDGVAISQNDLGFYKIPSDLNVF